MSSRATASPSEGKRLRLDRERFSVGWSSFARRNIRHTPSIGGEREVHRGTSDYFYAFVLPYFIENSSQVRGPDDMIRLSDLRSLQARLARNETVRVFANRKISSTLRRISSGSQGRSAAGDSTSSRTEGTSAISICPRSRIESRRRLTASPSRNASTHDARNTYFSPTVTTKERDVTA